MNQFITCFLERKEEKKKEGKNSYSFCYWIKYFLVLDVCYTAPVKSRNYMWIFIFGYYMSTSYVKSTLQSEQSEASTFGWKRRKTRKSREGPSLKFLKINIYAMLWYQFHLQTESRELNRKWGSSRQYFLKFLWS